jgi:hypothetical protein
VVCATMARRAGPDDPFGRGGTFSFSLELNFSLLLTSRPPLTRVQVVFLKACYTSLCSAIHLPVFAAPGLRPLPADLLSYRYWLYLRFHCLFIVVWSA